MLLSTLLQLEGPVAYISMRSFLLTFDAVLPTSRVLGSPTASPPRVHLCVNPRASAISKPKSALFDTTASSIYRTRLQWTPVYP